MVIYPIIVVIIVFIIATLLSWQSMKNGGWYKSSGITVSKSQPRNYVFSLVWIFLYTIYAIIWQYLANHKLPDWLNVLFAFNMVLNLTWVWIFFTCGDIPFSQFIILALLVLTFYQSYAILKYTDTKYSELCSFGMLLYAFWLVAATGLNFSVKY